MYNINIYCICYGRGFGRNALKLNCALKKKLKNQLSK